MKTLVTPTRGNVTVVETSTPEPQPGQVLVRVTAATINPVDAMVVSGLFHDLGVITHGRPLGLGWDVVGRVQARGAGVDSVEAGDRVAAVRTGFDIESGALAELITLPVEDLALVPEGVDDASAATIGMNALTAAQALDLLGDPRGRTLLVTGAAGAVGGFAAAMAVDAGWEVTGLARRTDRAFVRSTGARLVTELDHATYDAVLDAAALQSDESQFRTALVPSIAEGGSFVGVLGALPLPEIPGRSVAAVDVQPDGERLSSLLKRLDAGQLTARLAGTVPLERAEEAFACVAQPGGRGRWVVVS